MGVERIISVFLLLTALCLGLPRAANANAASDSDQVFVYTHDQLISLRQDDPELHCPLRHLFGGERPREDAMEEQRCEEK